MHSLRQKSTRAKIRNKSIVKISYQISSEDIELFIQPHIFSTMNRDILYKGNVNVIYESKCKPGEIET